MPGGLLAAPSASGREHNVGFESAIACCYIARPVMRHGPDATVARFASACTAGWMYER
jgi:hypothetical protein